MKIVAYIISFLFSAFILVAGNKPNDFILDSASSLAAVRICAKLESLQVRNVRLQLDDTPTAKYFESKLLANKNIKYFPTRNDSVAMLKIDVSSSCILDNYTPDSDSLIRRIEFKYHSYFADPGSAYGAFNNDSIVYSDCILRDEAASLNGITPLANANIPRKPAGFFDKVLAPAAYIGTAALTVFLFFTVRSR